MYNKYCDLYNDTCHQESKDISNKIINDYFHYNRNFIKCEDDKVRIPNFYLDHVNLRGTPHPNVANHPDSCLIDSESLLRNDKSKITKDRCNIQLYQRMFQAGPNLTPGIGDFNTELDILSGTNSKHVTNTCFDNIMEKQTYKMIPMLECVSKIQDHEHIVPKWIRGGEDTRNYINRKKFLEKCRN
jgi:hypothetical protein